MFDCYLVLITVPCFSPNLWIIAKFTMLYVHAQLVLKSPVNCGIFRAKPLTHKMPEKRTDGRTDKQTLLVLSLYTAGPHFYSHTDTF